MTCHPKFDYLYYHRIRRITTTTCLLLSLLSSHNVIASTTMLVPLKLDSQKTTTTTTTTNKNKLQPMSISSINGQHVLVLDEVTASTLKGAQSPVPILFNPLGESSEQEEESTEEKSSLFPKILFYDPRDGKNPKNLFDKEGKVVKVDLGKHDVLIVPPKEDENDVQSSLSTESDSSTTQSDSSTTQLDSSTTASNSSSAQSGSLYSTTRKTTSENSSKTTEAEYQAHDQMIIILTVATMAIFVGALSARKLRARQFLNSCIENEALEDEVAYDAAYTTEETGGSYDSFGNHYRGGDLRWRGDLEKFDV